MEMAGIDEWLDKIDTLDINTVELGLERVSTVYRQCISQRQQNQKNTIIPKVVTVAGTNGKGTTIAVLEQVALNSSLNVGAYTSPHLIEFNERLRLNGNNVSNQQLCLAFEEVEQCRHRSGVGLTYFEYTTLAALLVMLDAQLDLWVLEVGLGGRLDAVNIIDADVAIITSIAFDHTQFLGDTLDQIAFEKAGITRANQNVICGTDLQELMTTLACDYEVEPLVWERDFNCPYPTGHLMASNIGCALKAAEILNISIQFNGEQWQNDIMNALNLPCRLQYFEFDNTTIILDVAHNNASAQRLYDHLQSQNFRYITVVLGMMSDKDILSVIDALQPVVSKWILCDISQQQRAAKAQHIEQLFLSKYPHLIVDLSTDVLSAIAQYRLQLRNSDYSYTKHDALVVTGSFYTTGIAYQWLKNQ